MRSLFDVNVLIALLDSGHAFHQLAHDWWSEHQTEGWSSCPLVENGIVRIMTNPGYSASRRFSVGELVKALSQFVAGSNHEFWPDTLSFRKTDRFAIDRIHSGRQLTDIYLLALAVKNGGRLVTFDRSIPANVVFSSKPDNLCVL